MNLGTPSDDDQTNNNKENQSNIIIKTLILMCENQKESVEKLRGINLKKEGKGQTLEESEKAFDLAKKYLDQQISIQHLKEEIDVLSQKEQILHSKLKDVIKRQVKFRCFQVN
jgi:hypothetical protein